MRKIIHVDMDAFYASVEQRDDPSLRGKPVIVAWSPELRSVVVAASYEARKFGIHSAMPARRAVRLCPDAIFVKPDFTRYKEASRQIREIFLRHTPLVEPLSLDEAYLDVTEELTGIPTATETAQVIRREIREETNLTASAGVAPNKFLAKIASDWKKPDGLFVIRPHQVEAFLEPLPVGKIPGVGKATEAVMHEKGIRTVGDLRQRDVEELIATFGSYGTRLWELARGIDERPVEPHRELKSYSSENTFATDLTLDEVRDYMHGAARELWTAAEPKGRIGRTITVKLKTKDFRIATRRATMPQKPLSAEELDEVAQRLLGKFAFAPGTLYRLAGIGFSNFASEEEDEKKEEEELLFRV